MWLNDIPTVLIYRLTKRDFSLFVSLCFTVFVFLTECQFFLALVVEILVTLYNNFPLVNVLMFYINALTLFMH